MDTKTLVVGQKVELRSGPYTKEATVIGITDYRVQVEPVLVGDEERYAIHFAKPGKPGTIFEKVRQCGVFLYTGNGWDEYDRRTIGTEFGPWELVDSI